MLTDDEPSVILVDLEQLRANLAELSAAFPQGTLHAIALKASPLRGVVDEVLAAGCGLEAASPSELELALAGTSPDRVVFDSPVKTDSDLRRAIDVGVVTNADNLQELARIDTLLGGAAPKASIGLRVNPGTGAGTISATSTAVAGTKFGVCLQTQHAEILKAFRRYPWLTGLHVHVGSGGCGFDLLASGAVVLAALAKEVRDGGTTIGHLDIGGGLPVHRPGVMDSSFSAYVALLRERAPTLFHDGHLLITEMGRRIHASTAVAISRVEATKSSGGRQIALTHVGADLMLRTAYAPNDWSHAIQVLNPDGTPRPEEDLSPWDIAGPLCFSGDLIARQRMLPRIRPGDLLAVEEVGAYTLAMWSRYNSRRSPRVLGLSRGAPPQELRHRESHDEVLDFWR